MTLTDSLILPGSVIALVVTLVFMFALRPVAEAIGLVDRPGGRKSHTGDIPVVGGVAMFLGFFAGMSLFQESGFAVGSLMSASMLLVVVGLIDDRFHLPSAVRFAAQITVALIMVYGAGLSLGDIGDPFGTGVISLGPFELVFTVCVTLTIVNSYNLIDGVDGLAGTMAMIALVSVAIVGGIGAPSTSMAVVAAAAIFGYLVFNFPVGLNRPLRSFMGDAGSTLLGFTVVWITLGISQGPEQLISPVHCLWFAAIPVFDCMTCFVRRIRAGKSPFQPGRDHFHHTLKNSGMSER
ncbi:MAG: MraY family glycosyltransferase, partial [Woeseiaceae bacterium]